MKEIRTHSLNEKQRIFIDGKMELEKYRQIRMERPLTYAEKQQEDSIKCKLQDCILGYGRQLYKEITGKYPLPNDACDDVMQSIREIFYKQLPYYNPYRATPTTYFSWYFRQAIKMYVHKDLLNLSQYNAYNIAKVRKAIDDYDAKGLEWNEEMLMKDTGLTPKVLKHTLYLMNIVKQEKIESCSNLKSGTPTPEDVYICNENEMLIYRVLMNELTEEEQRIFLKKVNIDENRELPYTVVARDMGMTVYEVKKVLQSIRRKLQKNEILLHLKSA